MIYINDSNDENGIDCVNDANPPLFFKKTHENFSSSIRFKSRSVYVAEN